MANNTYNLTNPQKSIWFTEEFYKGTPMENIAGSVIINEKVNFELLTRAINLFVKNNDSFNLRFSRNEDDVVQSLQDFKEFSIEILDVYSNKDVKTLEKNLANTPFDVLNSNLYSAKLFKFEDGHGGFVISIHHLIADAWTSGLIIDGIINIYSELLKDPTKVAFEFPSYLDYIDSEQKYLNSDKFVKDKEFWNALYKEAPEIASIPSFNNSEKSLSNNSLSKRKVFTLPKETFNLINEFCKEHKASPFNFFMGIYALYVGRVSNLNEFVIGTPILNRSNFKDKHTTGMFISTVPFKVTINNEINFGEFISEISSNFFDIFRHQKYPYQYLLQDLRVQNPSLPNLYDIGISYQNMRTDSLTSEINFTSSWCTPDYIPDSLDIHFFDLDNTGNINIAYDYQIAKYTIDDICSIHARILNIINQVLENNCLLKDLEIVTPEEKRKLLYDFNDTKMDYPKDKTISQLFEEQVEKTPDNIAVVFGDQKLTYKELNEKSNSLAHYLRNNGVTRNDIVGIMVNRSLEMIVSIMAVLKSGACYIPIDPEYPEDRITYMLDNSNSKFLLTFKSLDSDVKFDNKIFVELSNDLYNEDKNNLENINSPEDLAYIIYTSGSTGKPKGVMLKHINVNNFIAGTTNVINFKGKNIVSLTTISFDIFVLESLLPLQNGLTIIIANEQEQLNAKLFNGLCIKNNVNIIQTTPSRFQALISDTSSLDYMNNITDILVGGEPFPPSLLEKLQKISKAKIYNMYGPTETAVWSTIKDLSKEKSITIGKPIANTQVYILDKDKNLLPPLVPGELYIGGDGVCKGYYNLDKLTKEKFIVNKYNSQNYIYATGDLAYFTNEGQLVHLGRTDFQVKIRGYRIELEEIENAILQFKDIKQTAVLGIDNKYLVCYYTANKEINNFELAEFLLGLLPNYMIPAHFQKIPEFPFTPNGKIDRKKLPKIDTTISKELVPARNNIDKILLDLFKQLLDVPQVSIEDNLFYLGGDSLSAINLCTQIYNRFNVNIYAKDILEHPVLRDLSDVIGKKSISDNISIPKLKKSDSYLVSSAQKRTYFASTMSGENSTLYNMPGGIIVDKELDTEKLEKCINELVNRHESLRTYFEVDGDNIVQKISENINFELEKSKNIINADDLKAEFDNFVRPFNLSKAPLLRAKIIKLNNEKYALFVDMHHIISDGTSLHVFINELCKLYNGETLEKLNVTYKDFASYENNRLSSGEFKEAEEFWVNQFKDDIPVLNMPTNYQRQAVKSYDGAKVHLKVNEELTSKINSLSKQLNVTPYMLLLSAYYVLLYKYTGQEDIVVGSPIVGRNSADLYNIIGMFVNSLPIRTTIDSNLSFKEFLNNIKNICLENYKYQDYPFDELVNKLNIQRDTSRNPLFDTMFTYQNNGIASVSFDGINSEYYIPDTNISKFDLSLEIIPTSNELSLSFEYCTKLFDKYFIESLANHYSNILKIVVDNLEIKLSSIDMLSEDERNKILYDFNDTKTDYPKDKTISQLFEEQVEKTPDNIAIVFEDQKLTYKELNEKANSLAHYLRNNGVSRNDIVGIMVNRSLEMIVSIMAILKSGGAYLLIDNTLPNDRIEYMLNNCNAKLLLTDSEYNINFHNITFLNNINLNINKYNLNSINYPHDNFSIIYTSGSTGEPKGALLSQIGVSNLILFYKKIINLDTSMNQIGVSSVSFDMFVVELFSAILLGRTLFLLNDEEVKNPILISKKIIKHNIGFLLTTPTKLDLLLSNPETLSCLKILRKIQLGGEVFTSALYEKLSSCTNAKIYNGYGPTEITACCSNKLITSKNDITIGKPNPNTKIYVLNKDMQLCPIAVPGEIYVGGLGVAKGYINNSEKTSASFLNNTFDNDIIYKTGDLAKLNIKGEIEYIGRNDFQVKLKGLRIELSEIENKFLSMNYITNCIVLTDDKKTYLKAFFTASEELNIPNIRKQLSETLPSYMIPNYIFQIDEIPITSNGKVDRKKLDAYKCDICNSNMVFVDPENETQKLFCNIWEDILQTKVGIDNDIFELGADSLSAIKFKVEALNNNIDIPYADIFRYKTIRKLSEIKNKTLENTPIENYDYTNINSILIKNKKSLNYNIKSNKTNNALLLGSNGFVGMHIINSFIKNDTGTIYCIMRDKNGKGAKNRFLDILHFYFGESLDKYIGNRLIILKGDILKPNFGLSNTSFNTIIQNVSVIINAAANVKHFGNFDKFKSINIDTINQTIDFCKTYSKRLIHLSTLSISGNMFLDGSSEVKDLEKNKKIYFSENNLFIHQSLDNVYTRSKFEAEKIILDNIYSGLDAQILRLGNIVSRYEDGMFQINPSDNAFVSRIKSIVELKAIPQSLLNQEVEFTPVDLCSNAIIKTMQNKSKKISVLHIYNHNHIKINKILRILNKLNLNVTMKDDNKFVDIINSTISNSESKKVINGIINDLTPDKRLRYSSNIHVTNNLSIDYLSKCKFQWKKINSTYIEKFIKYLKNINFFEGV